MAASSKPSSKLRAATWNIHGAVGGDGRYAPKRIVDVLSELGADVIALQEVPLQGPHGDFLVEVEHATGYHVASGPLFERRGTEFGNAVLSRRAFERVGHLELTVHSYEPRGALDVRIDAGAGRPLRVLATHLGLRPGERREQVKRLLAAVEDESPQPTMLMGDLNEWYLWGRPLRWLHAHFREKPEAPPTFPARRPMFALDRIWISPVGCLRRLRSHASPLARVASDHLPLIAEVVV
jgi:endonuclease/exonuclease/phosphatase family metal-dependent hydrolase